MAGPPRWPHGFPFVSEFGVDALKVRGYLAFNSLIRT